MMMLYQLKVDNQSVLEITSDVPAWFPLRQRLNWVWLRPIIKAVLRARHCASS